MPLFEVTFNGFYASTPSVGYTLYDGAGAAYQARTTSGVVNTAGNTFQVEIASGTLQTPTNLVWDDGEDLTTYASEAYNGEVTFSGTVVIVNDDLTCGT